MAYKIFSPEHIKSIGDNERIIKIVHRHWFNIIKQFFPIFLMAGFMFSMMVFLPSYVEIFQQPGAYKILLFVESMFFIFIWIFAFFIWIDYYFDIWIITSEKIINVEQRGMFIRSVSEVKFERIQDVTVEVIGMIPTILNYGDVFIQTAGEKERFIFRQVAEPYKLKDTIMELQKERVSEETNELGEAIRKEIREELV